jgi:hypothetical protein
VLAIEQLTGFIVDAFIGCALIAVVAVRIINTDLWQALWLVAVLEVTFGQDTAWNRAVGIVGAIGIFNT